MINDDGRSNVAISAGVACGSGNGVMAVVMTGNINQPSYRSAGKDDNQRQCQPAYSTTIQPNCHGMDNIRDNVSTIRHDIINR